MMSKRGHVFLGIEAFRKILGINEKFKIDHCEMDYAKNVIKIYISGGNLPDIDDLVESRACNREAFSRY